MNAQEVANLLTAAMAITTVWLGFETRRMAKAAKATMDLETRPYLSFRGFFIKFGMLHLPSVPNQHAVRVALRLFNSGKVQITYEMESMLVSLNGAVAANPHFDTTKFVIHPGEEMLFFYPLIASNVRITPPAIADVEFRLSFWSIPEEKKTLAAKAKIDITSETEHEWHYLEGPHYG